MILHLDPQAPGLVRAAAAAMLYSHIGGAFAGLVSGGAALVVRKGQRPHRLAGNVFFIAMLTMSGVGALVAPFLSDGQAPNTMMGAFTFYLVSTGWAAVRRGPGETGRFEIGAAAFAGVLAAGGVAYAWLNSRGPHPLPFPEGPVIDAFAFLVTLAAVLDIRVIRAGGLTGAARVTRHLWRMTLALLIAATSFAGQPKAIPPFLRESPLVLLPAAAVLLSLIYWLVQIQLVPALRRSVARPTSRPLSPAPDDRQGYLARKHYSTFSRPAESERRPANFCPRSASALPKPCQPPAREPVEHLPPTCHDYARRLP